MKILIAAVVILVGLPLLLALAGSLLPRRHTATRSALFRETPAQLYATARDFAAMPSWRSGLQGVALLAPQDGQARFREDAGRRSITYALLEDRPGEKLVLKIADDRLPFGGTWTYKFMADPAGTRLRITEEGDIKNPVFRFLARFVFGYTGTMDAYLRDLGRRFGETISPS